MLSTQAKILVHHALALAITAGSATLLIGHELNGSATSLAAEYWHLFLGLSATGAFCLGVAGVAGVGVALNRHREQGTDLNSDSTRDEIRSLFFFTVELCTALGILVFGGFVHF
jgi:hypothetical protein